LRCFRQALAPHTGDFPYRPEAGNEIHLALLFGTLCDMTRIDLGLTSLGFINTANIAGTRVALALFNYHHRHFSTEFAFDAPRTVVSGYAGFGLEHWPAAMCQAGTLQ
jgi:hypothetical protein